MAQTSSRNNRPSGRYQNNKKRRNQNNVSPAILVTVIILIVAIAAGGIYIFIDAQNGTIQENVTLLGINIGGMTQSEAVKAVKNAIGDSYETTPMVVTVMDTQVEILPVISKVSLDIKSAVKTAFRQSKANTEIDASPYVKADETAIRGALKELGNLYSSTLSQTTYTVTGESPNQVLTIQVGKPEYALDMNQLYTQVIEAYANNK
ncbi:MAG: hypothetical protein J6Q54_01285, partial [Oscillospiraceae bacterium]|nr:hypothetical protein [Oscillospiraceae bacterium]